MLNFQELAEQYGIAVMPTFMFFKKGEKVSHIILDRAICLLIPLLLVSYTMDFLIKSTFQLIDVNIFMNPNTFNLVDTIPC